MSTATDIIAKIDTKIEALLDDTNNVGDYKIGDKSVSKGKYLQQLTEARAKYNAMAQDEPYEDISEIAFDIDEFGVDDSEYVGSANS